MQITTTDYIPGVAITEIKETLFAEQAVSINVVKDITSVLKGIMGAKMDVYAREYEKARSHTLQALSDQAEACGADAIVNLRVEFTPLVNSELIIIVCYANGVAVRTEANENHPPTSAPNVLY